MGLGAMEMRAQVGGDWGREGDFMGGGGWEAKDRLCHLTVM